MRDLMCDIETLGTRNDSVITQIGACYFDRYTGEVGEKFLINVSIQDCLNLGLRVDAGAMKFWFDQAQKGSKLTFLKQPASFTRALQAFRDFSNDCKTVWSHPFDMKILDSAYRILGQSIPIHYRKHRDIRTLVDMANIPKDSDRSGKTHDALDDCLYQVRYCVKCFLSLRRK
ncbi:3'-5' exoribonuclease [Patescibacteria group bacterium]|nr:3'-5' exoribonuclease [Patescibacteria group bacterium]